MMLNNNRKASKQSQKTKIEPDFDSILEQILNLDTQKKTSEARSMKSALKPKEKKKSSTEPSDLCPYCTRPGHLEEKCYYKHPERASEDLRQRFQSRIKELRSKANATKTQNGDKNDADNDESTALGNRGYVTQQKDVVLATGSHDPNWYFDNAASYHMTFDLADFDNADSLTQCRHPQDDITLADGSVILPDGIGTITLLFRTKNSTEKIFLSGVRYCSKLDTKLISLGMLDRKGLSYSSSGGILEVRDGALPIMSGHLTAHNLYKVDLEDAATNFVTISQRAMTANTSKSVADLLVWHRHFAHLNEASIKELVTITSGMVISPSTNKLPFCSVCVEAKITRQPHRQPRTHTTIPGFRLHADVGGGGDTYATFRGYRYFILFVCEATGYVWVRFLKKKSEALAAFQALVTLLERQYGIRVCILHTDFGEFNSEAASDYFSETGIIWESSVPYAQQQNGLVERLMRTIVEGARAQIVDSRLPLKLWAESISTMVYLRIRSPSSAIPDQTITPFQAWHKGNPPAVGHIRIFGCTTYVFDETKPKPKLASKTWTGFLVGYEGHNQYCVYDPVRQAVYVRRDVIFDESSVGPARLPAPQDSLNEATHAELLFPTLSLPVIPWLDETKTIEHTLDAGTPEPISSQPNTEDANTASDLSDIPDESDEDTAAAAPLSTNTTTVAPTQRKSARLKTQPTLDYRKINQGRAANVKSHPSVPHNSPHSSASQALFQYALTHVPPQASQGFVRIARKGKRSTPDEPSLKKAMQSGEAAEWKEAMQREYDALIANGTWKLVERPADQHVLTAKWAFKRKRDIEGNIKRYKARWVARGFQQREGVDYFETFAAVVKPQTNKMLFAMTAKKRLHSHQLDMITAFLNSRLGEKVYIEQPLYFNNGNKNQVLLLLQGLYRLKQAARLWFDTFRDEMKRLGFLQSLYYSALYFNGQGTYVAVYVDDLHIVGPNLSLINELKAQLALKFKTTDLGPTAHYLGMEVSRDDDTITVTQTVYIDQLLETHQMSNCNPVSTPMVEGLCLAPANDDFIPNPKDVSAYKRFTGSVQWLACQTRPDILQTVSKLSHHNMKPTDQCWSAVSHLLRYLKGTRTRGIHYGNGDLTLFGYSDSSWADDLYSRRSTAGYVFILNNGPISWSSRRQATVSTSTCEAEYIAQAETACEAVWIRGLLGELGILETVIEEGYPKTISPPTTIFADNQGAVKLTENPEYHRKTKHIPIKYHKTRELVAEGTVHFEWIPTHEMVADGLTKPLGSSKFREFVEMLGMVDR